MNDHDVARSAIAKVGIDRLRMHVSLAAIEQKAPRLCAMLRELYADRQAAQDLINALPTCDQCDQPATHGHPHVPGRRCTAHIERGAGWLAYPRAQAQTALVERLRVSEQRSEL